MKMGRRPRFPQSRIDLDMLLRRALPAAHFDRNATTPVTDLMHWRSFFRGIGGLKFEIGLECLNRLLDRIRRFVL
jgi:hypothetical protein